MKILFDETLWVGAYMSLLSSVRLSYEDARRDRITAESDQPRQPRPLSSLLNQFLPRSPGWGGEEGQASHLHSFLHLTSREPPGDRRLPAKKVSQGQHQGGEGGRGKV